MLVIVVPYKVADNVSSITPVRQKMWLVDWKAASKEHQSLQQAFPKGYFTAFKMGTPILVTKLEGSNGYAQSCSNQDVVGLILLIRGIYYEYNSERQDTYSMMQSKQRVTLLC